MVQGICDYFLFVGGFHYRALDNKSMAKRKQNPLSKGGEEGINEIWDVNVQGERDCCSRSAYQSWFEIKRKTNTREHVKRYQVHKASKNKSQEFV